MHSKKKNGIPDRWTDYTAVGKRIPGTRFIAFKVPLKQSFRSRLTQSEVFGPFDLVRMLEEEGQELGLIIDLTFTTRYYKVEDLPNSLYHLKIFTAGHEVPNNATILSFKKAVRHFLHENENNDKLIGVHCTHGLNRTGYLICRYLIDVDGMKPQKAISLFNASRGHSIERQNYLDDLRSGPKRSNVGMEQPDQEPSRGLANVTQHEAPHHRREQHSHDPPFNGRGAQQWRRNPQHTFFNLEVEEPDQEPSRGLANVTRHEAPHHRREQHSHDPPFNGRGAHQRHRNPQHQFFNVEVEEPDQEPSRGLANVTRHEAPHHRWEQRSHDPPFNGRGAHPRHRNPQHTFFNVEMEEPDQEPSRGLANVTRHEAPHHRREQHSHDPPFNGRGAQQRHRNPQHTFFPFHQRNNTTSFRPPEPQSLRPPLFPHPPPAMRPTRPGFPNQSDRGFYFSPSAPVYEPSYNPHAPPESSTMPPGPHRKPRHKHRKGPKDRTPR